MLLFKIILASERFYLLNMSHPGYASVLNNEFIIKNQTKAFRMSTCNVSLHKFHVGSETSRIRTSQEIAHDS